MDISSLSSVVDIISDLSFKDVLSLIAIGYQLIGNKLKNATEIEELPDSTSEVLPTSNTPNSLVSIIRDNAKNRAKALIQKFHNIIRSRSGGKKIGSSNKQ